MGFYYGVNIAVLTWSSFHHSFTTIIKHITFIVLSANLAESGQNWRSSGSITDIALSSLSRLTCGSGTPCLMLECEFVTHSLFSYVLNEILPAYRGAGYKLSGALPGLL